MKPSEVKAHFGTLYRFNKETGMSCSSLRNWLHWGYIPIESQFFLEDYTKGKLKASWEDAKK